jgi:NAD(P)-dependent dehydrogenase (short-subunit alcohol dehydrogenase family)
LSNTFIAQFQTSHSENVILNISSGAANTAIDGWSVYCSTKAALDMFSKVIAEEKSGVKVLSIAPGKVDTEMQSKIRKSNEKDFKKLADFVEFKNKGELTSSKNVAIAYLKILDNIEDYPEIVSRIKI